MYGHDAVYTQGPNTAEALKPTSSTLQEGMMNLLPTDVDRSLDEAMSSSLHNDAFTRHSHPSAAISTPTPQPARPLNMQAQTGFSTNDDQYNVSPVYLSTLCDRLLKHHLPSDDYASPTERAIVTEILASAVLSNVIEKLSKGWMLTKIALAVLGEGKSEGSAVSTSNETRVRTTSRGLSDLLFDGYHTIVLVVYQVASILLALSRWYTATSAQWKTVSETPLDEQTHRASVKTWTGGVPDAMDPTLLLLSVALDVDSTSKARRFSTHEIATWVKMVGGPLGLGKYADK